jgi:hypothetical protein
MAMRLSLKAAESVDVRTGGIPVDPLGAPVAIEPRCGSEPPSVDVNAPRRSQTVVCTLGMHRSGTSVVSRILNLLGVYLGAPHDLLDVNANNPKGYWEHSPIVVLNDELLTRFGGRWDEPPAFPPSWLHDPRLADLRERARAVLADTFSAAPVWGWKDPRTCLTLPFWQDAIGSIRYVICIRNPDAVFASLSRRDRMSSDKAERLWLTHVQSSLAHTSGQPRMFVFYDDIMHDWAPEVRRIAAFIGHPERADDPDVLASVGTFLERALCHHRMTIEDLATNHQISFATTGLYLALRSHAPRRSSADDALWRNGKRCTLQKTLEVLGTRALETWEERATLESEHQRVTHENRDQATVIGALSVERDRLVAEHDRLIAEHDRLIGERDRLVAECGGLVAEVGALGERAVTLSAECEAQAVRQQQLEQATASIESALSRVTLDRDSHARDRETAQAQLREIHESCAWQLVTAARRAIVYLLPAGTARQRIFRTILRFVARRVDVDRRAA